MARGQCFCFCCCDCKWWAAGKMVACFHTPNLTPSSKFGKDILSICKHLENFLFSFKTRFRVFFSSFRYCFLCVFFFATAKHEWRQALGFVFNLRHVCANFVVIRLIYLLFIFIFVPLEYHVSISNYTSIYFKFRPFYYRHKQSVTVAGCWCCSFFLSLSQRHSEFLGKFLSHQIKKKRERK